MPDQRRASAKRPLLCADAPALLYRAFFALPKEIKGKDDQPVNALLGSVNALISAIDTYNPRAVVLCFGPDAATYRVDSFPAYHSARPPMPDELSQQWIKSRELYEAFGWLVADTPDLEADDLLHSFALCEEEHGGRCLILTGDRDMFQSVTERTTVLLQVARGPLAEIDPAAVKERYGIRPSQVPDFIALRGDPSDGIPGAKGIGPKTATDLLRRYNDLEGAFAQAIRERPAVRHALISQREELLMFRELAALRRIDVGIPPDAETDWRGGSEATRDLGMGRLSERVEKRISK